MIHFQALFAYRSADIADPQQWVLSNAFVKRLDEDRWVWDEKKSWSAFQPYSKKDLKTHSFKTLSQDVQVHPQSLQYTNSYYCDHAFLLAQIKERSLAADVDPVDVFERVPMPFQTPSYISWVPLCSNFIDPSSPSVHRWKLTSQHQEWLELSKLSRSLLEDERIRMRWMPSTFWYVVGIYVWTRVTLDDPHVRARGLLRTLAREDGSAEVFLVQPLKFDGFATELSGPPPTIGEDNETVFGNGPE